PRRALRVHVDLPAVGRHPRFSAKRRGLCPHGTRARSDGRHKMKLAFAIEDNVGNTTYRKNLAHFIAQREDVQAEFVPVKLIADDIWQLLPVINANYALTASARAASSLHAIDKRLGLDAAFIHSQSIALFGLSFMHKVPTVISSDATPANFDTLAQGYGHEVRGPGMERFKKHWTRATFKAAAKLLGFSEWVKDSYVND